MTEPYELEALKRCYIEDAQLEEAYIKANILKAFADADAARLSLSRQADPMGLQTKLIKKKGRKKNKPPTNMVGDVTPEHFARLKKNGFKVQVCDIENDRGEKTGNKRKRILCPLDTLLQRKSISPAEHAAGKIFQQDWYAAEIMPSLVPKYQPRVDSEVSNLELSERQVYHRKRLMAAREDVDTKFHPALAWIVQLLVDPTPLSALGAWYTPDANMAKLSYIGTFALRMALWDLCNHYKFEHDMNKKNLMDLLN